MFQRPGTDPLSGHHPVQPGPVDRDPPAARRLAVLQELRAAHRELEDLRSLLDTLPEIFERKFEERMAPILTQRQRLLEQNGKLRQQVLQLQGSAPEALEPHRLPGRAGRPSLGQALRHAFGLEGRRPA
ncbi:hypothetical protein [Cyanobium sp. NIES-981]|uniref:hypothetical protein n=1 Tax=Cyanobium sp. NIES-981 TaxID=1851505 RepID=UPI0007DDCCB1|nr:hypothetical protein [Cyanobium sp. NIES-981]SBO44137.1 conserved protein of unknown function [Cyanobium sp. NIES-981]